MRILLIGSGGREHALAWKINQSKHLEKLFIATGNGGTQNIATNIKLDISNHQSVIDFCQKEKIDLIIIGPEIPLVAGLVDDLQQAGFNVFGPSKAAAQLEGSKAFTKELCEKMNIPTAAYAKFDNKIFALEFVKTRKFPLVIKADGLAAGKGVTIATNIEEASKAIIDCFSGAFGAAGTELIVEEFLEGEEVSIFAISDGKNFITLASAQDHKRAYDGDKGPNTGGMGAYSPAPMMNEKLLKRIEEEIIEPTIRGMREKNMPFSGVLFAGLMIKDGAPYLIEHNARFGDPECQVLMMRLKSDILDILMASAKGDISNIELEWKDAAALTVVMAAKGYPASYEKGDEITLGELKNKNIQIFHAGTKLKNDKLLSNGGRVLNITAIGDSVEQAQKTAYEAIKNINWENSFYRKDIGYQAVAKERDNS
jgi:phosphoribosylamine--glycine ligase